MNKPTKKGFLVGKNTADKNWEISVCNKSCDEWEKFLPDIDEILTIMKLELFKTRKDIDSLDFSAEITSKDLKNLAEAIAKRIGK